MKGIILAGGIGSRLYPITKTIPKALLPIYDKPMIYYPLSTLMGIGIKEILIITTEQQVMLFKGILGDGHHLGISISYGIEYEQKGIGNAFLIGEQFIGNSDVALILVDNIFYGSGIDRVFEKALINNKYATILGYKVKDPERFGVVEFDQNMNVLSLEEKPQKPKSNYAAVGLYFYNNSIVDITKTITPSRRGELEITDINNVYLKKKKLKINLIDESYVWFDTGTHKSFIETSEFIRKEEEKTGLKIGCIEEIALKNNYINREQFLKVSYEFNNEYGIYLRSILER